MEEVILLTYFAVLIYSSITDLKSYIIQDRIHIIILVLALIQCHNMSFLLRIGGAALLALPFLILAIKTDKFGGGDIKFIFSNTVFLGFVSSYIGILFGLLLVIIHHIYYKVRKKTNRHRCIPLAPYLSAGYILIILIQRFHLYI